MGLKPIAFVLGALLVAACGNHPSSSTPQPPPALRLVRCAAAMPSPQVRSGEVLRTTSVRTRSWGVSSKRGRIVVGRRPTVTIGLVTATGPTSKDIVMTAIRAKLGRITACWPPGPPIRSATRFRLSIAADGSVSHVGSGYGVLPSAVERCVRRELQSIRYPAYGTSTLVAVPLVFDSTGAFPTPATRPAAPGQPEPWTPFAIGRTPVNPAAIGAARATEAMVRGKLGELDKCFAPSLTGSLRVLLEIDIAGELGTIRPGGLGNRDAELCAAKTFSGTRVMTPLQEHVEVACDFARGDARPWRVTPDGGYKVIDVQQTRLEHGSDQLIPGAGDPSPLPADTYVVVAHGDTLGGMMQLALMWARDANAVLLAVADGKPAPLFLGMGDASAGDAADDGVLRATMRVGGKTATGCVGRTTHKANVTSSTELGGVMQKLAARCRTLHCAPTLMIAIDSDAVVRDLLEVASAARRHGFDRVLFGGAELGCDSEPVKKHQGIAEPDPDLELE